MHKNSLKNNGDNFYGILNIRYAIQKKLSKMNRNIEIGYTIIRRHIDDISFDFKFDFK